MNARTLVLNKSWLPINVVGVWDALHMVFNGRAMCVDVLDPMLRMYDFENWCLTFDDAVRTAKLAESQRLARINGFSIMLPEIVACTEYRGFGFKVDQRHRPKFSRRNLYLRDRNTCMFCGMKLPTEELTMDHVVPKSKGGKVTWTNIVLACVPCNGRKGDKTLAEAGMKLIRKPFEPKADDLKLNPVDRLRMRLGRDVPKTWEGFLGKMYWSVEIKD